MNETTNRPDVAYRTFKYRLRPNKKQAEALDLMLWYSRTLYNLALEQRIKVYQETGKGANYLKQWPYFRDLRNANPDTYGLLNASSLQHLLRRLDKAFERFYKRVKLGQVPGFPKFKKRKEFKSIEFTYKDGCKLHSKPDGRMCLYILRVGEIRMCFHRPLPNDARIKHVVLRCDNERWYAILMMELPKLEVHRQETGNEIGLDMGLLTLLALSDGTVIENPRWQRVALKKLNRLNKKINRQKIGSQGKRATYHRYALAHEKVANQRRDFFHKLTRQLVNRNDMVAIEDMDLTFMTHNKITGGSIFDAGLGIFRSLLIQKAEETGCKVVAVNPRNTSQICSVCGQMVPKTLNVREHRCPNCNTILDRDVNAARNILALAKNRLDETGRA